jgi:hypothetical protein
VSATELTAWVHLRFSRAEKDRLAAFAQDAGLSLSQLVRQVLRGETPQRRVLRAEFRELQRVGLLLKKVLESQETNPKQVQRLLDRLEAALGKMSL